MGIVNTKNNCTNLNFLDFASKILHAIKQQKRQGWLRSKTYHLFIRWTNIAHFEARVDSKKNPLNKQLDFVNTKFVEERGTSPIAQSIWILTRDLIPKRNLCDFKNWIKITKEHGLIIKECRINTMFSRGLFIRVVNECKDIRWSLYKSDRWMAL